MSSDEQVSGQGEAFRSLRVLVLAPTGRDSEVLVGVLSSAGLDGQACRSMGALCQAVAADAGAAIVAAEALDEQNARALDEALRSQPEWSDFPVIVMANRRGSREGPRGFPWASAMSHLVMLERPVHTETLLSAVRSALRSRRRQYQIRDELRRRRRAEEALGESEARFRVMADGSPVMIWACNAAGAVEFVSRAYCDFFGTTVEAVKKQGWQPLVHPEDHPPYTQTFAACLRERRPFHAVARVRRADGAWRWIESFGAPRISPQAEFLGMVGSSPDITERQQLAEERERHLAEIAEANEAKDLFFNALSHELRTPLAAMLSAVEVLRRPESTKAQRSRVISLLERNVRQQAHLIDDLLDLSRIMRGKVKLDAEPIDLRELVAAQVEAVEPEARKGHLAFSVQLPEGAAFVLGDAVRLSQVLGNLLTNAIKFTKAGGSVTTTVSIEGSTVTVRVKDTGIGIQATLLAHLFEPFRQGDTSLSRRRGGLGIGLAIARSLAELNGGTLEATSDGPDRGSEFVLRLPHRPDCAPLRAASAGAQGIRPGQKVLLVEDSPDLLETMTMVLELMGYTVVKARDGATAIEVARAEQPAIALVDIGLPDIDGYELAQRLRGDASTVKVRLIALTGYATSEHRARALQAGFEHHLAKPVQADHLRRVLEG